MRTPLVVGNWKLHKTVSEALTLVTELKNQLAAIKGVAWVAVAPPFTALTSVAKRLEGSCRAAWRRRTATGRASGAFTGEVSPPLCWPTPVVPVVHRRPQRAPHPVLGGGDSSGVGRQEGRRGARRRARRHRLRGRDGRRARRWSSTFAVLDEQLAGSWRARWPASDPDFARLVVAYEPVWAIGTGRTASPGPGAGGPRPRPQAAGGAASAAAGAAGDSHPVRRLRQAQQRRVADGRSPTSTARWSAGRLAAGGRLRRHRASAARASK
jgi:triosephosphate isomerase